MAVDARETILVFAANASDRETLRIDWEMQAIRNVLRNSRKPFNVDQLPAATRQDLEQALIDSRPEYVHFCGHGTGEEGIVLDHQFVDGEALADLFGLFPSIKCVVLNACLSAVQAEAIKKRVDYVVGMRKEIGDAAAIEFATAFYRALGSGEPIKFAFAFACAAIRIAQLPEHLTPQLLSRSDSVSAVQVTQPDSTRSPRHDWDGAPAVSRLYGREDVAEMLRRWILDDFCRVVLITGMGGIGKTEFATCLGRGGNRSPNTSATLAAGIEGHFDSVLWRSLLNAPQPHDLFADMLGVLSEHTRSPTSTGNPVEEILRCLQERRCLVILDNVEAVLKPGDPLMRYRDGYELYGSFFDRVATGVHQSCMLLTSREKPRGFDEWSGAQKPVRSIALPGIGPSESQHLFADISMFRGSDDQWARIVNLYGGNPLALELVAHHIDQVYGGDLDAFLDGQHHLFSGIEELLDWHVDRLSDAETELLYWLAIEREPVTLATLYDDLASPVSRERITSTLENLQRRIPLERVATHHFSLQPVLIEYMTARLIGRVSSLLTTTIAEIRQSAGSATPRSAVELLHVLNRHALVKATAKESVRDSQQRLILGAVAERAAISCSQRELRPALLSLFEIMRRENAGEPGYAAGNILNLLVHLKLDLHGADLSQLRVWQATLHEVNLHKTNFSFVDFRHTTFRHAFGTAFAVAYSNDGQLIAVGDDNGEVLLFFAATGQLYMRLVGHSDAVFAIAFSNDDQMMASAGFDNTIRLWNIIDGRCTDLLLGHGGWVYSLAFSPDGRLLASASEDGTCRLWDLQTGNWVSPATSEPAFLAAVAFSPDGQLLAAGGSSGAAYIFRLSDLERPVRLFGHTKRIRSLAFSRDGHMLASGAEDGRIIFWNAHDGTRITTLSGHTGTVMSLSFNDAGDVLASASDDQTTRLWNVDRKECLGQIHASASRVWAVACNPRGKTFATVSEDSAVRVWDIDSRQRLMTLRGYSNMIWSVAFVRERSCLVAGSEDGVVRIWDTAKGEMVREMRGHASRVWAIASSDDERWIASASDDLTVRLWDITSGRCKHAMRGHTDWIRSVAFSPESQLLASGGEDGKIVLWDVANGGLIAVIDAGMDRVISVAFSDNGEILAAGGSDHNVRLFSVKERRPVADLSGHQAWVSAVVPLNASTLASCSEDGYVRIWDLQTRVCMRTLNVGSKVWSGAPCDGGRSFLCGSEDGMLRRWELATGTRQAQVRAHQGSVWSVAINAEQDMIATAGDDSVIRLWRLSDLAPCVSPNTLHSPRPYEAMNISGATGLSLEQKEALVALGAIEMPSFK